MLRLSEAIRKGSQKRPQCFGVLFVDGRSCALGAAAEAGDIVIQGFGKGLWVRIEDWPKEWSEVIRRIESDCCPECGWTCAISHLNDHHRWSRERIADFVELYEPLPIISTEELEPAFNEEELCI